MSAHFDAGTCKRRPARAVRGSFGGIIIQRDGKIWLGRRIVIFHSRNISHRHLTLSDLGTPRIKSANGCAQTYTAQGAKEAQKGRSYALRVATDKARCSEILLKLKRVLTLVNEVVRAKAGMLSHETEN